MRTCAAPQRERRGQEEGKYNAELTCYAFQSVRHYSLRLWFAQRADAEAAKLYQEFEQFFGDSRDHDSKAFVRGGTIQPGSRPNLEGESTFCSGSSSSTQGSAMSSDTTVGLQQPRRQAANMHLPSFLLRQLPAQLFLQQSRQRCESYLQMLPCSIVMKALG